jgi:hypothetical protein
MEPTTPAAGIVPIIRASADRHGVPRKLALAFAWLESQLDPTKEGDLDWSDRKPDRYRHLVKESKLYANNPARNDPSAWHSYGLFQLLAPYHCPPREHPRCLLDPELNAELGCKAIARLLVKAEGDILSARFAYVGAGFGGQLVGPDSRELIATRLKLALERFKEG